MLLFLKLFPQKQDHCVIPAILSARLTVQWIIYFMGFISAVWSHRLLKMWNRWCPWFPYLFFFFYKLQHIQRRYFIINSGTKEFQWCREQLSYTSSPDAYHSGVLPSRPAEGSQSSTADTCRVWCHRALSCADAGFQDCRMWKCICDSGRQCLEGNATASADAPLLAQRVPLKTKETKRTF